MRHTELRSPIDGLIWRFNTVNSEHAAAGDSILSMVDCGRQFIIAEIPQDRTPDVALHQSARFRLAGESKERTGSVLSVSGEARYGSDAKFAAFPKTNPDQGVSSVIIAIDTSSNALPPDAESCLVGRSVRVLIPTAPSNLASRWIRDHF
jgi:multidrug resistance efflux pump